MDCGWLPGLSTAILRNADNSAFGPTNGKVDLTLKVSGLPHIIMQPLWLCIGFSLRSVQGVLKTVSILQTAHVIWASPPNKVHASV